MLHTWARELDNPVCGHGVSLQLLQDVQDRVLATNSGLGSTDETNIDRFRHFEPGLTGDQRKGHIGCPQPDGQAA